MNFKQIKPPNGWQAPKKPGMYRACVFGNRREYDECAAKLMASYLRVNGLEGL